MKRVGVLGSGVVGQVLADGFLAHGFTVMRGSRNPAKLTDWQAGAGVRASVGTFAEAATHGEIVVLAVKGDAAESAIDLAGAGALAGKLVIDTTNPIAPVPPVNGVLSYFTTHGDSLMERLQRRAPAARFVKAFSCVGNALMVNPQLAGGPPDRAALDMPGKSFRVHLPSHPPMGQFDEPGKSPGAEPFRRRSRLGLRSRSRGTPLRNYTKRSSVPEPELPIVRGPE